MVNIATSLLHLYIHKHIMVIINILGGLGNQMFQYAFGYAVSKKTGQTLLLDLSDFENYPLRNYELDVFQIKKETSSTEQSYILKYRTENRFRKAYNKLRKKDKKHPAKSFYQEPYFHFDRNVFDITTDTYFQGYWQSEKYFLDFEKQIRKQFTLAKELHPSTAQYKELIASTCSVSLHIRRGDYVTNQETNEFHGTCSLDYYHKAISAIKENAKKITLFIFSDDLEWAKHNLHVSDEAIFVTMNQNVPDVEEMYLMSQCNHHIIANSSFSWWGAWLNPDPNKIVIAPVRWFVDKNINTKDLIPDTWVRL